jgi:hypothetical protein
MGVYERPDLHSPVTALYQGWLVRAEALPFSSDVERRYKLILGASDVSSAMSEANGFCATASRCGRDARAPSIKLLDSLDVKPKVHALPRTNLTD